LTVKIGENSPIPFLFSDLRSVTHAQTLSVRCTGHVQVMFFSCSDFWLLQAVTLFLSGLQKSRENTTFFLDTFQTLWDTFGRGLYEKRTLHY